MRLALLALLALVSAGIVLASGVLMKASYEQTAGDLERAYVAVQWGRSVAIVLALAGLGLAVSLWRRRSRIASRVASLALLLVLVGAIVLTWRRPAENVFAPIETPGFDSAASVDFLEPEDMVLGVRAGDAAKAYPVGQLVYHHLVNDVVGGVPVVATF